MKTKKVTTIDEFTLTETQYLLHFRKYWKNQNGIDPEKFPLTMDYESFLEQANIYMEVYHNNSIADAYRS